MTYHRAFENGTVESAGISDTAWQAIAGELTESHVNYFRQWETALSLEERSIERERQQV